MKLVKRKTRKAIEKGIRKALKKHGPALLAAVAGSLLSSIATVAGTTAADKPGTSKLAALVERAKQAATTGDSGKVRGRQARRESAPQSGDTEDSQLSHDDLPEPRPV